jgi:hypothetical protein
MKSHVHHTIPRSRGGTDESWNLVELDPYTHAYEHALDFVLFEHAPHFDFRHQAWPLLPVDLQKAVLNRHSEWLSENNPMYKQEAKDKISAQKKGENHHFFGVTGEQNPHSGMKRSPETCLNISKAKKGKPGRRLSEDEKKALSERMSGDGNPATRTEVKKKISETKKGKPLAINDKPKSESHRESLSKALKEYHAKKKAQNEQVQPLV